MATRLRELLASLNDHDVRYVVIGAMAFPAHGYLRNTADTDIFFEPTPENGGRLRRALEKLHYPVWEATDEELLTKKLLFEGVEPELDTHPAVKGATWEGVWSRRLATTIDGVPTHVAALDDLIAMKRAAGRPKDLLDLPPLEALRARREAKG